MYLLRTCNLNKQHYEIMYSIFFAYVLNINNNIIKGLFHQEYYNLKIALYIKVLISLVKVFFIQVDSKVLVHYDETTPFVAAAKQKVSHG